MSLEKNFDGGSRTRVRNLPPSGWSESEDNPASPACEVAEPRTSRGPTHRAAAGKEPRSPKPAVLGVRPPRLGGARRPFCVRHACRPAHHGRTLRPTAVAIRHLGRGRGRRRYRVNGNDEEGGAEPPKNILHAGFSRWRADDGLPECPTSLSELSGMVALPATVLIYRYCVNSNAFYQYIHKPYDRRSGPSR